MLNKFFVVVAMEDGFVRNQYIINEEEAAKTLAQELADDLRNEWCASVYMYEGSVGEDLQRNLRRKPIVPSKV